MQKDQVEGPRREESSIAALIVTGNHGYEREPFEEMFRRMPGVIPEFIEHPQAQRRIDPERVCADAVVLFDMPGIEVPRGQRPDLTEPVLLEPSEEVVAGWHGILEKGTGIVFLHHALAGWPAWPEYADLMGGRFNYVPLTLRGQRWPDSGYRLEVDEHLAVVAPDHPVTAGLADVHLTSEETFLCPVFDDEIIPLLVTDAPRTADAHYSIANAWAGRRNDRTGWSHPTGSAVVAWAKMVRRSRVVVIQPGHAPSTYANPGYRRLLANAIHWVGAAEL